MGLYIYSWNNDSAGSKELAVGLGIRRIRHENSKFIGGPKHTVINWGSSNLPPEVLKSNIINSPIAVGLCTNKLYFFRKISDEGGQDIIPVWTTSYDTALDWVANNFIVCARTILQGHSGKGLVLMDKNHPKDFVQAPLYTRYIKKRDEYRIHIFRGEMIDAQRKALSTERANDAESGGPPVNWKIRNLANGFVYVRQGFTVPDAVKNAAIKAVEIVGLDFGAVDVVQNGKGDAFVLEINCAPGLEGTTINNYIDAFRRM